MTVVGRTVNVVTVLGCHINSSPHQRHIHFSSRTVLCLEPATIETNNTTILQSMQEVSSMLLVLRSTPVYGAIDSHSSQGPRDGHDV